MNIFRRILNYFNRRREYGLKNIIFEKKAKAFDCVLEGNNKLYQSAQLISSHLGRGSYVGADDILINTRIGRFTSIGPRVRTVLGQHPSSVYVSTHPAFFSLRQQSGFTFAKSQTFPEFRYVDDEKKTSVIIGSDVWIGSDVIIMEGIRISHGAIVAAGSVVTKDVAPYSIVGGAPARHIKDRFSPETISFLLTFEWWNKDDQWLQKNVNLFQNIDDFSKALNSQGET